MEKALQFAFRQMGDILALPVKKVAQNRPARFLQGSSEELVVVCRGQGTLYERLQLKAPSARAPGRQPPTTKSAV